MLIILHTPYNVRPPFDSVQLVPITPISLWLMVLTTIVTGANLNQLITGGGAHF